MSLSETLASLGLHHTAQHLDDLVALAARKRWSATQTLEYLGQQEAQARAERSLLAARRSRYYSVKTADRER